jgi:hypothetical protein
MRQKYMHMKYTVNRKWLRKGNKYANVNQYRSTNYKEKIA